MRNSFPSFLIWSALIAVSSRFGLHLGFCAASVRCRVRPVKKAENGRKKKTKIFFSGRKKQNKGRTSPYTGGALCMAWMWCFFSRKYQQNSMEIENCIYATGKKDGWLIAVVLLQPLKLVFPGHPDMCYWWPFSFSFFAKIITHVRLNLFFSLGNKDHLPLNVVFARKNLLY